MNFNRKAEKSMAYAGAVKINKQDPKGDIMDIGFVINYAFDKKGMSIPLTDKENSKNFILEAIQKANISNVLTEMRMLSPRNNEGTYIYNEETNVKNKDGTSKYRHVVQLSGKQIQLLYIKGQDAVLQNENKAGTKKLMLGCKCPVGEVANSRDAKKLKEWRANRAKAEEKPTVRSAGLYPKFKNESAFGKADVKIEPDTLEKLDQHEKDFWYKESIKEKERLMNELVESLDIQETHKENDFQLGE